MAKKASKGKEPDHHSQLPRFPLCFFRKGVLLFLQSNGQARIPDIPQTEKSGVKCLLRGGRSVIQIVAVLSLQCTRVCDILKVAIVEESEQPVPLVSAVSHIPAASSEVQAKLGGHAAGCMAPFCLFKV